MSCFFRAPRPARVPGRARGCLSLWVLASALGSAAAQTPAVLPPDGTLTLAQALRAAQDRSLTLRAQDARTQAARESAVAAGQLPDPVLQLSVDRLPVQGPMAWTLGADFMTMRVIGLSQTLTRLDKRRAPWSPDHLAQQLDRDLAASLAKVDPLRLEREEMARAQLAQTQAWWDSWQSQLARLDLDDSTLPVLAGERSQAALAAYRSGQAPLTSVLEARRQKIDTRLQRLRLEMSTAALWPRLEYQLPEAGDAVAPAAPSLETAR